MKKLFLRKGSLLVVAWGIFNILLVACEPARYAECKQMIALANNVTKETQAIAARSSDRDFKNWLEASKIMKQAVTNIKELELRDSQLNEYQGGLANLFRIYFQATEAAVKAREKKDLSALQSAHDDVNNIQETKKDLVENINSYCIE